MKKDFAIIKWYVIGFAMTLPVHIFVIKNKAEIITLLFAIHSIVCIGIIYLMKRYYEM